MRRKLHLSTIIAVSLIGMTASAFAQGAGTGGQLGVSPGTGTVPPVGAAPSPAAPSTATTGMSNSGANQPGVPNTSTPGRIGTGASPSGLPGDDPDHPGYPARVRH
jgi:hypothetical protein